MGVALVFVAATLVTYVRSNTLRTLHGKCEFMFLLGLLLIHLAYPWKVEFHRLRRLLIKLLYLGCLMTAFWKNVLVFDIWWTFRSVSKTAVDLSSELANLSDTGELQKMSCCDSQTTATMPLA